MAKISQGLYRHGSIDLDVTPITVAWETTRACALRCLHCRADAQHKRHPHELTTQEGINLIQQVKTMGAKVLVLTGGDPLIRHDIFDLIKTAADTGLHVGFSPSVTGRLTPNALHKAVEKGVSTIHLSLDGASIRTHDALRGVTGSFDKTLNAIETVSRLPVNLQIGTTVAKSTLEDIRAIPDIIKGKATQWVLFFLVGTGRASNDDSISPREYEEILEFLVDSEFNFGVRTVEGPAIRRVQKVKSLPVTTQVTDGRGFCFVSHTGDVTPSGFLPLSAGNIRGQRLSEIYQHSPLFLTLRNFDNLKGKCGICEFKTICGGSRARAWAHYHCVMESDPLCGYVPGSVKPENITGS
jgi:radical SAM protein with 4Fe4S-binding SPASM domain